MTSYLTSDLAWKIWSAEISEIYYLIFEVPLYISLLNLLYKNIHENTNI